MSERPAPQAAFQAAVFLAAFLLFLVQPLIAKQILPWFGGAPAVWTTCLLFFQTALVVGYGYAHVTRRLGAHRQVMLHVGLLALGVLLLPIAASEAWKPADASAPAARVLLLLTASVGAPYVLLSATAPLLQDWYARVSPGRDPYRLYVLSNAGSLLALLSYPVVVERYLPVAGQSWVWSAAFVVFVLLCAWCGRQAWSAASAEASLRPVTAAQSDVPAPAAIDRVLWLALPAVASGLLLAVTNQLCQDVAVVPLLWIVPLSVYLLTFIISFGGRYRRGVWGALFALSLVATGWSLAFTTSTPLAVQVASLLFVLASGAMICHGELVHLKPGVAHLTAFYLALSVGGGLGGAFVSIVAPLLFVNYAELPFLLMLVPGLALAVRFRDTLVRQKRHLPAAVWAVPMVVFAVGVLLALRGGGAGPQTVATARNFYGILRVADDPGSVADPLRGLYHGRVLHGAQFLEPARALEATTYFGPGSGADLAISRHPARIRGDRLDVAIIGLGAGTIAAWGRPGDRMRFYELNPQVVDFAHRYFSFLSATPAEVAVVTGDARLSLEREAADAPDRYDVLIVDAFSGDSIPVHLLTREGFALYRNVLREDGVLAFHVSNQFLDIAPVVRGLAGEAGMPVREVTTVADPASATRASLWMLVSSNDAFMTALGDDASRPEAGARSLVWTDQFSSLVSVMR